MLDGHTECVYRSVAYVQSTKTRKESKTLDKLPQS